MISDDRATRERAALQSALNDVHEETVARGMNQPASFGGNRAQRRSAKRAYDRMVRQRERAREHTGA